MATTDFASSQRFYSNVMTAATVVEFIINWCIRLPVAFGEEVRLCEYVHDLPLTSRHVVFFQSPSHFYSEHTAILFVPSRYGFVESCLRRVTFPIAMVRGG